MLIKPPYRDPLAVRPYTIFRALLRKFYNRIRGRLRDLGLKELEISDKEIATIGPFLQRVSWSEPAVRGQIQKYGVNITPVNFYSNTPSFEDIDSSFEYNGEQAPYANDLVFDRVVLAQTLTELMEYSLEFNPPLEGDEERPEKFFWGNSQFSYSDAMAYHCFIRKLKPKTIVEIGSGFSTLVAIEAIKKNRGGQIVCIEPFPRPFLEQNSDIDLIQKPVQEIDCDYFNQTLQDGDILFIDSTHTVKTGSDCLHIYLRLLPHIKRNIHVHVHDVFLPFGMPKEWLLNKQIFWTEQYLLFALLTDNPKAKVRYGSAYNLAFNKQVFEKMMNNRYQAGGGSFWFDYSGRVDSRTAPGYSSSPEKL